MPARHQLQSQPIVNAFGQAQIRIRQPAPPREQHKPRQPPIPASSSIRAFRALIVTLGHRRNCQLRFFRTVARKILVAVIRKEPCDLHAADREPRRRPASDRRRRQGWWACTPCHLPLRDHCTLVAPRPGCQPPLAHLGRPFNSNPDRTISGRRETIGVTNPRPAARTFEAADATKQQQDHRGTRDMLDVKEEPRQGSKKPTGSLPNGYPSEIRWDVATFLILGTSFALASVAWFLVGLLTGLPLAH
jgi:hypothetical protein